MNSRSNYALSRRFFSARNSLPATLATPRVVCVAVLAALGTAAADDSAFKRDFVRRPYVGLGFGATDLDPESRTPSLTVGDNRDAGGAIFLGYDFAPHFSVEAYYSDLGAAGIDFLGEAVGSVDYQVYGVSVLGYFGNSRDQDDYIDSCPGCDDEGLYRREGLTPFVRLGVGGMRNDSALSYDRDHTAHLTVGAGLEYGWSSGVAVRAEIISYDTDAHYAGLGIYKRFGDASPKMQPVLKAVPADPNTRSVGELPPVGEPLDFPVPTFEFGKYSVTPDSTVMLDALAARMRQDESLKIIISGHTDSIGSEQFNHTLSLKRAASVKAFMIQHGIDAERMKVQGFGELQPVDTNSTTEGRAANRRVQFAEL